MLTGWCSGMVDVLYASAADMSSHQGAPPSGYETSGDGQNDTEDEGADDAAEAAWLESVQAAGMASNTGAQDFQGGSLVMDIGQLRDERMTPSKANNNARGAVQR